MFATKSACKVGFKHASARRYGFPFVGLLFGGLPFGGLPFGGLLYGSLLASALLLNGCAVEVQNFQAAKELEQQSKPPGSVYAGWRVFQARCASCHGMAATGTVGAPNLLPLVQEMGQRRFVGLVLQRYDWNLPALRAGAEGAGRDALLEDVMQRKDHALTMPAWNGEPQVNAHIVDIFAYLSARAQGAQGTGRPAQ